MRYRQCRRLGHCTIVREFVVPDVAKGDARCAGVKRLPCAANIENNLFSFFL